MITGEQEWKKEATYLYLLLKELYEKSAEVAIALQSSIPIDEETEKKLIDSSWTVFCIEKNLKSEEYEI